jgi:hypothetical protein
MAVGIRAEYQNAVSSVVVGFPPGLKAGIPSLREDGAFDDFEPVQMGG